MTFSTRTVIRPHLLLDAVTGELLADAFGKRCRSVSWQCAGDPEAGEEP